ncbi:transposase family protein [Cardinium endosymbiont of Culicoides punctatus]|uniref:transposase family protein n=1 Tax=Cardinium endosymbiont of Culicoides punctatus TaxID=2304601 RepID=UPI001058F3D9|nr:transposase family protein [Cardinium endosymbiont of Culicoides punctatus]TDG95422.1 hypothetical protein CCPUN_03980 [Cardinium endosymbiont of Culicoides punctatus]
MGLIYKKLSKHPFSLRRLLGIELSELQKILFFLTPVWASHLSKRYKGPGRHYKHDLGSMVSLLLIYYRSYLTQEFLGYLFDLDKSNVCRIIQQLEPLLSKILPISSKRFLSKEEVETIIIDVTEQPIERPKKDQESYYSGKKKQHTVKKEIRINESGTIVHLSKTHPGKVHDFSIFKQEPPPDQKSLVLADSGYQGIENIHNDSIIPYKSSKNNPLTPEKKVYNQILARDRVLVEHKIRSIKVFKIIGNRYRNKRKRYDIKFEIVAGLVNLKNGSAFQKRIA